MVVAEEIPLTAKLSQGLCGIFFLGGGRGTNIKTFHCLELSELDLPNEIFIE